MTLGIISDKDMRHCHFLKSTCDIGGPHQGPKYLGPPKGGRGPDSLDPDPLDPPLWRRSSSTLNSERHSDRGFVASLPKPTQTPCVFSTSCCKWIYFCDEYIFLRLTFVQTCLNRRHNNFSAVHMSRKYMYAARKLFH